MASNTCDGCGSVGASKERTDDGEIRWLCTACRIEENVGPEAAAEYRSSVGRKGAEARLSDDRGLDVSQLPDIRTYEDVLVWGAAVTAAIAAEELDTSVGNTVSRLLRECRSALESAEGRELSELEDQIDELRKAVDKEPWQS